MIDYKNIRFSKIRNVVSMANNNFDSIFKNPNKWSFRKPINCDRMFKTTEQDYFDNNDGFTFNTVTVRGNNGLKEFFRAIKEHDFYNYEKPVLKYKRMGDFRSYNESATISDWTFNAYVYNPTFNKDLEQLSIKIVPYLENGYSIDFLTQFREFRGNEYDCGFIIIPSSEDEDDVSGIDSLLYYNCGFYDFASQLNLNLRSLQDNVDYNIYFTIADRDEDVPLGLNVLSDAFDYEINFYTIPCYHGSFKAIGNVQNIAKLVSVTQTSTVDAYWQFKPFDDIYELTSLSFSCVAHLDSSYTGSDALVRIYVTPQGSQQILAEFVGTIRSGGNSSEMVVNNWNGYVSENIEDDEELKLEARIVASKSGYSFEDTKQFSIYKG